MYDISYVLYIISYIMSIVFYNLVSFNLLLLNVSIAQSTLMIGGIFIGSFTFSTMGLIFGSIPTRNPGDVQMPSTLIRWVLLFVSGVFVPLSEMSTVARGISYLSPLTYAQDLMNHAVLGTGELALWLNLSILFLSGVIFLLPSIKLHKRGRVLGY